MWQTPGEAAAQAYGKAEYHRHCFEASTPALVPHTDQDYVLQRAMHQEPALYNMTYQQNVQTPLQSQGNPLALCTFSKHPASQFYEPRIDFSSLMLPAFSSNVLPLLPLPGQSVPTAVTPLVFPPGNNRNRAENVLDEFGLYFGKDPLNLEALQKISFIAGMQFVPSTIRDCRNLCFPILGKVSFLTWL